jgi:hypothetical protein
MVPSGRRKHRLTGKSSLVFVHQSTNTERHDMKTITLFATVALALWLPAGTAVAAPVIQTAMAENEDSTSIGRGWHIMLSILGN